MKEGVYFEVEGLEKALMKLEKLKDIDRKKARQFKAGIRKAAKPMVKAVKSKSNIKDSDKKTATTRTVKKKSKESTLSLIHI